MAAQAAAGAQPPKPPVQSPARSPLPVRIAYEVFTFVGEIVILFVQVLKRFWRPPFELREVMSTMAFVGAASIPIVALTTFASGAVLSLYTAEILLRYGAGSLSGATVGLAVTREIAPVLAGIMVAARCGSAMSAQIGSMVVTEQVEALRSLDVSPIDYIVTPRFIACLTMLPILSLLGMYAGVYGGYAVSVQLAGVPSGSFVESIRQFLEPWDIWGGLIKATAFGAIVALVACQQGLRTTGGAIGVGNTTTRTVVITMVLIYVANYFLAAWLY